MLVDGVNAVLACHKLLLLQHRFTAKSAPPPFATLNLAHPVSLHLQLTGNGVELAPGVHGNHTVENTTRNALAIIELAGVDVPLAMGCGGPLAQRRVGAAPVHGKGGLDGVELPEPKRQPVGVHAVDFIIDMASRHRGELVLASIGPGNQGGGSRTESPLALARCYLWLLRTI